MLGKRGVIVTNPAVTLSQSKQNSCYNVTNPKAIKTARYTHERGSEITESYRETQHSCVHTISPTQKSQPHAHRGGKNPATHSLTSTAAAVHTRPTPNHHGNTRTRVTHTAVYTVVANNTHAHGIHSNRHNSQHRSL